MSDLVPLGTEEKVLIAEYAARKRVEYRELAEWQPEWFLGKLEAIRALEHAAKETYAMIKDRLIAEKNALIRRHGFEFKAIVDYDLKGAKRKSVTYGYGVAGYRKSRGTITITDEAKALEWCGDNCPEALETKIAHKKPMSDMIIGMIEADGECPEGFEYHKPEDRFYPDLGGVSALPPKDENPHVTATEMKILRRNAEMRLGQPPKQEEG